MTILVHITWQWNSNLDLHDETSFDVIMKVAFISLMTSRMTTILFNIQCFCISKVCWMEAFILRTIGFGLMVVLSSLKARPRGSFLLDILI